MQVDRGSTDVSVYALARDDTTRQPQTGLAHGDVTAYYTRDRAAPVAISLSALASAAAAHSDGGFFEVSASHAPGRYRLDLPDAAVASGSRLCGLDLQAADTLFDPLEVLITEPMGRMRRLMTNRREIYAASGNAEIVFADDGTTPFATVTLSEPETSVLRQDVEFA